MKLGSAASTTSRWLERDTSQKMFKYVTGKPRRQIVS